jgi:NAD(P)-dependent dehydrogenase (short-subunit alcohol dehydrogenase family)
MDLELAGKVAYISGGSKGIGKAIARELAFEGVDIALAARTQEPLENTAKELRSLTGRKITTVVADAGKTEAVDQAVEATIAEFGTIDILVNCAAQVGGANAVNLSETIDQEILEDFNVKFLGYLRTTRAIAPVMQKQGWGRVINIGGLAARNSGALSGGARNVAVVHMTKTLADELGSAGITVNVIHPALTKTERVDENIKARAEKLGKTVTEVEKDMGRNNAIKRIVDAQEIAYVAAFLASPKAGSITGDVIAASGGSGRSVYY